MKDTLQFILAGNALFTVENAETGNRFTFKVRKPDDDKPPVFSMNQTLASRSFPPSMPTTTPTANTPLSATNPLPLSRLNSTPTTKQKTVQKSVASQGASDPNVTKP